MPQRQFGYTNVDVNRAFILGLLVGLIAGLILLLLFI